MSEMEQMYREVILDHYKSPRGHGLIENADAQAEGQNPLCGDEVTISVKFAADDQPQSKSKPFEMVVRTGAPVPHWYFGLIVHDFAGMHTKPVVAVDWNHDPDELIGKAGEFDTSTGDLIARGTVESIEVGDQADKIIKLSSVGVPYEASIYFDPYELVLENVPEGFVAEVNKAFDVDRYVAAKVTLHHVVTIDHFADCQHFGVRECVDPLCRFDLGLGADLHGIDWADAIDVAQRNRHWLVGRDVDACNTGHACSPNISNNISC